MSYRKVEAGNGVNWLSQSANLLLANPAPFALMGLLIAVITAVPVLGGLAMLLLGPALYAGFMAAAHTQVRDGRAEFGQLFTAFQTEGKLPKMLALCLPAVAAVVVLTVIAVILLGGALLGGGVSAARGSDAFAFAALGGAGVAFVLIALVVGFVAHALVFFAMPRVLLDDLEPFPAMRESWSAVLANLGGVLVFLVLLLLASIVISVVVGLVSSLLAQLVWGVVIVPLAAVGIYRAYADVFGAGAAPATDATAPPANPAAPPPAAPPQDTPPPPAGPSQGGPGPGAAPRDTPPPSA